MIQDNAKWLTGRDGYLKVETRTMKISDLVMDKQLYSRGSIREAIVYEYASFITSGVKMPNVVAFQEKEHYPCILADGWHRVEAIKRCMGEKIKVDIYRGNENDAAVYSVLAAIDNGIHRDLADRRTAVRILHDRGLVDSESVVRLAKTIGVTQDLVKSVVGWSQARMDETVFNVTPEGSTQLESGGIPDVSEMPDGEFRMPWE